MTWSYLWRTVGLVACTLCALAARADEDSDREKLVAIVGEIKQLQALVAEAARTAQNRGRVKFHYEWLASDLQLIADGIVAHTDAPRQPRPIAPLRGDYRR